MLPAKSAAAGFATGNLGRAPRFTTQRTGSFGTTGRILSVAAGRLCALQEARQHTVGDSAAHRGALRAGGVTIAVLGNGLDVVYPEENAGLYRDIAATGALLSEYPPGTAAEGWHFPIRNRIISGLCLATVVVEAPLERFRTI